MRQLTMQGLRRTSVEAPGLELAALQAGSGTPVLLVPGYTGSKEDFAPIMPLLAEAGFTAVAIDLPGQYESAGSAELADYGTDSLGAVVRAVASTLGDRVQLLGHSFGGLVARAAVLGDPNGFGSLVLMGSGPAAIEGDRRSVMAELEPLLPTLGMAGIYDLIGEAEAGEPGLVAPPPDLGAFLRARFVASSPVMLQGMGDALRSETDRVDDLARTGLPVMVLCGCDDDAWPVGVQAAMARRLGTELVVIPDAMHSPAVENPAPTAAALVDFWQQHR